MLAKWKSEKVCESEDAWDWFSLAHDMVQQKPGHQCCDEYASRGLN